MPYQNTQAGTWGTNGACSAVPNMPVGGLKALKGNLEKYVLCSSFRQEKETTAWLLSQIHLEFGFILQ